MRQRPADGKAGPDLSRRARRHGFAAETEASVPSNGRVLAQLLLGVKRKSRPEGVADSGDERLDAINAGPHTEDVFRHVAEFPGSGPIVKTETGPRRVARGGGARRGASHNVPLVIELPLEIHTWQIGRKRYDHAVD